MKKKITSDHFKNFKMISHLKKQDDTLYFIQKQANLEENTYDSDLYQLQNGTVTRLTASRKVNSYELMDGGIVFPALREAKDQEAAKNGTPLTVWQKLTPGMGEAMEWKRLPYTVSDTAFLDNDHFFFTAVYSKWYEEALANNEGDQEKALKEMKDNAEFRVWEEIPFWSNGNGDIDGQRTRLYYYDAGEIYTLCDTKTSVYGLKLSPEKKTLVYMASRYEGMEEIHDDLMTITVAEAQKLAEEKAPEESWYACGKKHVLYEGASYYDVAFKNETEAVVLVDRHETYGLNENAAFFMWDLVSDTSTMFYDGDPYTASASEGSDCKMGTTHSDMILDETGVIFIATVENHTPIIHVSWEGEIRELTEDPMVLEFTPSGDGFDVIAMVGDDGNELYHVDANGQFTALTTLNKHLTEEYDVITPEEIHYVGSTGLDTIGWIVKPAGYEEGKKYPTILDVHGGPKTVYGPHFFHEMQYWANEGFCVIFTNIPGSDGRGNEYMDIRGIYGTIDFEDLMIFCDEAIRQYDCIDADRMGVTGGSYGGFMTNWIIGHTDRFKAAASQRSISNWTSFANTSDIGYYFGEDQNAATPWNNQDLLWEHSPLKYADRVKTPTLFLHSDEDTRCWMVEGIQMFYALKFFGVDSRLILFNKETHELSRSGRPKSRIRRNEEITNWMKKYLMN